MAHVAVAAGIGLAFVWLFAPSPTAENSSPPPEPFLFIEGAMLYLAAVIVIPRLIFIVRRLVRR